MFSFSKVALLAAGAGASDVAFSELSQYSQALTSGLKDAKLGDVVDAHWHKVNMTEGNRTADVYVPGCASKDSPILLVPHGLGYTPDIQKKLDSYTAKAEEECVVVVYPLGAVPAAHFPGGGFSWNAGGCCPGADVAHVDDVTFLEKMVDMVAQKFQVDGQSVFVSGISNGAMMANRFACESSRVKGLIAVAGPLINGTGNETFTCPRKVPSLYFHGTRDPLIPLNGCNTTWSSYGHLCPKLLNYPGYPEAMPAAQTYVSFLRARNGITEDASGKVTYQKATTTCTSWGGADNNVTFCEVGDLGHMWPGAKGMVPGECAIPWFHCNWDVDATAEAYSFIRGIQGKKLDTIVV